MKTEQFEKLEDAVNRSANKAYCGSKTDSDLLELVKHGYMKGPIRAGFIPESDAYFQATRKGISFIQESGRED